MKSTVVVGFGYKMRSGKNEACAAILAARGDKYDIKVYGFADALKREVNDAAVAAGGMLELFKRGTTDDGTPFPAWVQYDTDAPMDDPFCPFGKQRLLQQWWGTDFRRAQDPNYWVAQLEAKIEADNPRIALVCDLRFPNEVAWVKSDISNSVVRVDRLGYKSVTPQHESETALDWMEDGDWHIILRVPDGEVEELRRDAVVAFDVIMSWLTPPDLSEFEHFEQVIVGPAS